MVRQIHWVIAVFVLLAGCTFNIQQEVKEVTLSSSSAGLTEISINENLLEDNDVDVQGITAKQVIVTAVARMLVLKDSDDDLDNLQMSISSNGEIGYSYPGDGWSRIEIDEMSILMDKTLDCELETVSGNVQITDVEGFCKITTTSGNCDLETIEGCSVKTKSGDAVVSLMYDSLQDTTTLYIETESGDVDIYLPSDTLAFTSTVCLISIETTSGDVTISIPYGFTANLDYSTSSGDKDLSSGFNDISTSDNSIDCETTSGDLTIKAYTP